VIWFYNKLQDRGDCQNARKSYKTSQSVGWVIGWEQTSALISQLPACQLTLTFTRIMEELPVILEELKKSLLPGVFSANRRLIAQ
jgi:hypothetical protein